MIVKRPFTWGALRHTVITQAMASQGKMPEPDEVFAGIQFKDILIMPEDQLVTDKTIPEVENDPDYKEDGE